MAQSVDMCHGAFGPVWSAGAAWWRGSRPPWWRGSRLAWRGGGRPHKARCNSKASALCASCALLLPSLGAPCLGPKLLRDRTLAACERLLILAEPSPRPPVLIESLLLMEGPLQLRRIELRKGHAQGAYTPAHTQHTHTLVRAKRARAFSARARGGVLLVPIPCRRRSGRCT